jgi:signal transduction histidine kinase
MLDFAEVEDLDKTLHPDFMGYGSAAHEFFRTREDVKKMAEMQAEQLKGSGFRYSRMPVSEKVFAGGDACLILENFQLFLPGSNHQLELRLSVLLEKIDGKWLVTHFHGSSPDTDIAEDEAFPEEGLRRKNLELEAKIKERTRDLEIEAALERTRAQSMLMQHSSELNAVSSVFHEQLLRLGIDSEFSFVWLPDDARENHIFWTTWTETTDGEPVYHSKAVTYPLDLSDPYNAACIADWESGVSVHEHFVPPSDIADFFASWEEMLEGAHHLKAEYFPQGLYYTEAFMKYGCFGIDIRRPLTEEEKSILHRFAIEFERTYTRFLDLQKAEAQAREARIETALEKVRTHTMGMRTSEDLSGVTSVMFEQMKELGGDLFAFGVVLCSKDRNVVEQWHSLADEGMISPFQVPVDLDYIHQYRYDQWKSGKDLFSIEIPEDYIQEHFGKMYTLPSFKKAMEEVAAKGFDITTPTWELDYGASFSHGYLLISSLAPFGESHIFPRFARVFEQAYTRFLDLQKAEAQAREAQIEAALERVRSRTMAMQHSDELAEASHLLDREVRGLGIKTWGCAFNIYREDDSLEWFGNEAGLLPTYTVPRQGIFKTYFDLGQKGESLYIKEIAGEECTAHYEFMSTLPVVGEVLKRLKETNGAFPSYQIDHVAFFKYGYLLFITRAAVPEAHDVFKRFARVFEQTYTRFLDLQLKEEQAVKLVAEKQRLEKTLSDLQATQKQLVHAEKMASLGELTAGIAHEIQNPLNFVNNFSEVSRELLEELLEELKKGDAEEVDAIARDIEQNLEKIVHHGKRADSIVKGMLQHSRSSDGQKEPTDLNALADEYLRLAYHGLRAKDKSFNASMETDFDEAVGTVDVIPQDIGRVLLNLVTNAFHAVTERKKHTPGEYDPRVTVKSRRTDKGAEICVIDNGGGIPEAIREKIFQPFFTTKPTGEGTGLGLSMSYDIISKGHGGQLTLETTEGEGTIFKIVLPLTPEKA